MTVNAAPLKKAWERARDWLQDDEEAGDAPRTGRRTTGTDTPRTGRRTTGTDTPRQQDGLDTTPTPQRPQGRRTGRDFEDDLTDTVPDAAYFERKQKRRGRWITLLTMLVSALCGVLFTVREIDSPILPFVFLIAAATPVVVYRYPRLTLYVVFAGACLFELYQTGYKDAITDKVPFFWNVNTIVQTYAKANFKAIPLSLLEVFLAVAGIGSLLRNVYNRTFTLQIGPLFWPIFAYIFFVTVGWVNGILTGGDFKISLQEVRGQFYFLVAYLMGVNLIRDRQHLRTIEWLIIICMGIKGILYTYRRYVTLGGLPVPDQGVGSHEEAFLFNCFATLLLIFVLCRTEPRMQRVMWLLLTPVVLGNLACNRRAGTAALLIMVPFLFLTAFRALPDRRRMIAIVAVILSVFGSVYYQAYKNKEGMIAQPARAIKSHFEPNARDKSSNDYRDAENANQMETIRRHALLGYGYGKRFYKVVPMVDISGIYEWWDILPHNQILWVWMRVGTLGFIAFWMMIGAITVRCCRLLSRQDLRQEDKAFILLTICSLVMLLMFGLLDLQLSNYRDMLFVATLVGCISSPVFPRDPDDGTDVAGAPTAPTDRRRFAVRRFEPRHAAQAVWPDAPRNGFPSDVVTHAAPGEAGGKRTGRAAPAQRNGATQRRNGATDHLYQNSGVVIIDPWRDPDAHAAAVAEEARAEAIAELEEAIRAANRRAAEAAPPTDDPYANSGVVVIDPWRDPDAASDAGLPPTA